MDLPKTTAVRGGIDMIQYPDGGCYFNRLADNAVSRMYTTDKEGMAELNAGRVKWQIPTGEQEF